MTVFEPVYLIDLYIRCVIYTRVLIVKAKNIKRALPSCIGAYICGQAMTSVRSFMDFPNRFTR